MINLLQLLDPQALLRVPYKRDFTPDTELRKQITRYFSEFLGQRPKAIEPLLPDVMPSFGKLRIEDGDSIRSASASGISSSAERDMSFVRVYEWQTQISYGQLERVVDCLLPKDKTLGRVSGKRRLLAIIHPCKNTRGKDASLERTGYTELANILVTDLQSVVAVVGRVKTRGKWLIVDRTGGLIHPQFVQDEEADTDSL
ncbi:hypothetical protein C8F04DRAFT_979745 [Mycena alexandri]|uniref:Uncharacterized protein n=1 Tax=Mycena alexandri TaxID=1745969 RepID=A0AAD6RXS7_9AGAR|nr:hypothetical protein C8F04DRAFT_979745 [Mycena alexandri]